MKARETSACTVAFLRSSVMYKVCRVAAVEKLHMVYTCLYLNRMDRNHTCLHKQKQSSVYRAFMACT